MITENPTEYIGPAKTPSTLPIHLSIEECEALLNSVDGPNKERNYAIITLFLNCGLRLSELCGINLTDFDKDMHMLKVTGKGSKERIVYLNDACRAAIEAYMPIRNAEKPKVSGERAMFLSRLGTRLSVKTVQWMVKKYLGEAGLEYKNYSTHKLRHTAATLMYQSGDVDIRVLKDILGHEQLNTTQIYTHVSDEHMEEAMSKNPLSSIKPKKEE